MRIKDIMFDFRLFVPYLIKKFFLSFYHLFTAMRSKTEKLNRTYIWVEIFFILTVVFFITGYIKYSAICFGIFIIAGLRHEWIKGSFREEYQETLRRRQKLEEDIKRIEKAEGIKR